MSELKSKVESWLSKQGFPLEFRVANVFQSHGFSVRQGDYVQSEASEKPREIDVVADWTFRSEYGFVRLSHVVECKWSKGSPWVVFTSTGGHMASSACIAQTISSYCGNALLWIAAGNEKLHELEVFHAPAMPGFGGRRTLSDKDDFYSAVQGVVTKATLLAGSHDAFDQRCNNLSKSANAATIACPLVVIDGPLFTAEWDKINEKLVLNETKSTRIHWRGSDTWNLRATVDIVTVDYLDEFLAKRVAQKDQLKQELLRTFNNIHECIISKSLKPLNVTSGGRGVMGAPLLLQKIDEMIKFIEKVHKNNS